MRHLNLDHIRNQFPALTRTVHGNTAAYFDGPAGSQVPQSVIDAVADYLASSNANRGGPFVTSVQSDATLDAAHHIVADFLGAQNADEVIFGANMTTLTLSLSRALSRTWSPGDEVLVTQLDHDANVTPWVLAARDAGATIRHVNIQPDDCTLDIDDFTNKLSQRTKLVAIGYASNAVGTINPIREITRAAHDVGATVFVDAVHFAPHGLIDVEGLDCDFLVCSAYKFFGPHVGILWGRQSLLETVSAYKVRPAARRPPGKWMTGTQNHEGIAGVAAAINYLAGLGRIDQTESLSRRDSLVRAFNAIGEQERQRAGELLSGLSKHPRIRVYGITDPKMYDRRVPTVSFTHADYRPSEIAGFLADRGIFVWTGNHYSLPLTEALGLEPDGTIRIGLLHYNSPEEIERLLAALGELSRSLFPSTSAHPKGLDFAR